MTHVAHTNSGGRLALEWTRLRSHPDRLARAAGWQIVEAPLDSLDQILEAIGFEQPIGLATEIRLRRLVAIAATDELAARVVIQRLLPGLLATVRRRRGAGPHVFDELLGAAWIVVRTYNHARAPRSIAASLLSDADYLAFRAEARKRSSDERPSDTVAHDRPAVHEPSACEQLAELMTEAEDAGVPAADLDLLRRILDTPTAIEVARLLQVTPRTVRNRRDRITTRLREVALAA